MTRLTGVTERHELARMRGAWAALLMVGGLVGCGGPTSAARHGGPQLVEMARETRDETSPREWVWVEAPVWESDVRVFPNDGATSDYCATLGSVRACSTEGEWREVALGSHREDLGPTGRAGEGWIFEDRHGRVFVADGFTSAPRELPETPASNALGEAWHPAARMTLDGTLLRWSDAGFAPLAFPGRVYDASFSARGRAIVLAEPGEVYLSERGESWTPWAYPGVAPESVSSLDTAVLPPGFASVVEEAADPFVRRLVQDEEAERSLRRALIRRFADPDAITLPDLIPSMWRRLGELGIVTPSDAANGSVLSPLATGWLVELQDDMRAVLFHVSPSAEIRQLVEGPEAGLLASHDGQSALVLGEACPDTGPPTEANACFTDASGALSIELPPNVLCARVLALGAGQLLVGGDGCPPEVCAGHPLVRFDLQQRAAPLQPIPVPIEGDAPTFAAPADLDECDVYVSDSGSSIIPDGRTVRLAVATPSGPRLLAGPVRGLLRSLPLPITDDDAGVVFAEPRHGLLIGDSKVWTTSDGGSSWHAASAETTDSGEFDAWGREPGCSADACSVGPRYWMRADLADRAGFVRVGVAAAPTPARTQSTPSTNAWRQPEVTRPSLTPTASLVPLRAVQTLRWPGPAWRVVGGVVETAPSPSAHPGAIRWHGVTAQGAPFHVATTAGTASAPLAFGDHVAVAATERFVALLRFAPNPADDGSRPYELVVVRRDGGTSHYAAPFERVYLEDPEGHTVWPLPLLDGGLGLYVVIGGLRWVVRFSRDGVVMAQRTIRGLQEPREEALAWHDGQLGLAIRSADGVARLYLVSGGDREIPIPQTPGGACRGAVNPASDRYASSWGDMELGPHFMISSPRSWTLSEASDGGACIRATAPRWGRNPDAPRGHGSEFALAINGDFRGWFISAEGTVEWEPRFPGHHMVLREEWWGERRWPRGDPYPAVELVATASGFEMWVAQDSDVVEAGFAPGMYAHTWGDAPRAGTWQHTGGALGWSDLHLRPGILVSWATAFPLVGAVPQRGAQLRPPSRHNHVDAVGSERGLTLVRTNREDGVLTVDWVSPDGAPRHASLAGWQPDSLWRRARLTPDGSRLLVLAAREPRDDEPSAVAELGIHALGPDDELAAGPLLALPLEELGWVNGLHVASSGDKVMVAITGHGSSPITMLGAATMGTFRRLGHPIATSNCGAQVLAIDANPSRVVWTDCALGTRDRFLRVAQLSGNRWREVVPARPLGTAGDSLGAVIDAAHGIHVVTIENSEAVLMTLRGAAWEEVSRFTAPVANP